MARIFLTHRVRDYAEWRQGYDADAERRSGAGFSEVGHYHSSHDPNVFLIVWDLDCVPEFVFDLPAIHDPAVHAHALLRVGGFGPRAPRQQIQRPIA